MDGFVGGALRRWMEGFLNERMVSFMGDLEDGLRC